MVRCWRCCAALLALHGAVAAPAPAAPASAPNSSRLLFFDGRWVESAPNLTAAPGRPRLLSTFTDTTSFTGWGYPSVWPRRDGQPGFHLVYNGDFGHDHLPRIVLLLQSRDGVNWREMPTPMLPLRPRLAQNELRAGGTNDESKVSTPCAARLCASNVHDCRVCIDVERGTVSDESGDEPLRMLLSNSSVLESTDGIHWQLAKGPEAAWRPSHMDPMIGVFRTHSGNLTVTSRPGGALRHQGRHLGAATASSWAGVAQIEPTRLLPIDLTYRDDYQMYGMPTFPWDDGSASLHVAFVVRMVPGPLATGGARYVRVHSSCRFRRVRESALLISSRSQ
jgi:hypothetical protein